MHGSSVNLGFSRFLNKAASLIVLPPLSGSAIGDLSTQQSFTPTDTVFPDC